MKTIINIKTDRETKMRAAKIADELGLTLSAVIQANLKEFIRSRSLYVSVTPKMSPYLERLVGVATRDLKARKNVSGPFRTSRDLNAYLDTL